MRANTSHKVFPVGSTFGFAAETLHANKFMNLHIKAASHVANVEDLADDWTFNYPTRPSTYRNKEAQNMEEITQFDRFKGYEAAFKMKVTKAYDKSASEVLHDELLEFTHVTLKEMLKHLEDQCHALTFGEKATKIKGI